MPGILHQFGEDALYLYQETNGMPGLQRQDDWRDDTCGGEIPSDTIVF